MNPISAFFVRNIVIIFFVYGLAFFALGLALALASRRASEFAFVRAIRPLAAFGVLHGIHEWVEMFQKIGTLSSGYTPQLSHEIGRLVILVLSFLALLMFGLLLLSDMNSAGRRWQVYLPMLGMTALWGGSTLVVALSFRPPAEELVAVADALARYSLGIPGSLLGTWAMMAQQRTFREHGMPQFGQDLVWSATALFLYGVIGQIFVRQTLLFPSMIVNSTLFLQWFGIPVQLFRGVMAAVLAVYMVRALSAFDLESRRRLEAANQAKLTVQAAALEAERRISHEMERLNEELRLTAHELSLLLDLSNLLVAPSNLPHKLHDVLDKIVVSLKFPEAGMILLVRRETRAIQVGAAIGFIEPETLAEDSPYRLARSLGEQCIARKVAVCRHLDGQTIEFIPEEGLEQQQCRLYASPVTMISLPLTVRQQVIGSLVLGRLQAGESRTLSFDEFQLTLGLVQQLGLSLENVRLYQEAQERENTLGELLHQVVGAQETERQRIARELHDATGQSLTAIALGLRGVEAMLGQDVQGVVEQVKEIKSFSTNALGELRRIIADLRPSQLDDLGLIPALQWYAQEFERRYRIDTDFIVEGTRARLSAEYETVLFRITQEALTNIAKHAQASQAVIRLQIYPEQVCVTVQDNGRGFDPKEMRHPDQTHSGWGLLGIQERTLLLGGQYEFDSKPGQGTRIQVKVPLRMETKSVENKIVAGG